jgi:hypothetical protein
MPVSKPYFALELDRAEADPDARHVGGYFALGSKPGNVWRGRKGLQQQPVRPVDRRPKRQAPKTKFKGLIDLYLKSSEWQAYKSMTRKTRGHIYGKWAALGYDTEDITRSVIIEALEGRKETPEQANSILTALKNLFAWAVSAGHVDRNPCEGIKGLKPKKAGIDEEDGHKTWSEAELAQFERVYPLGSYERLVYSILLYTGLRIGDAARLGRQHIQKDGTTQLRNEKTGALSSICRSSRRFARRSPPAPRGCPSNWPSSPSGAVRTSVKSTWGRGSAKPPSEPASSIARRTASARPPLDGSPRPARRSISLMAIFGWARPDMAIKYTREANKKHMAAEAIGGLVRAETENVYSSPRFCVRERRPKQECYQSLKFRRGVDERIQGNPRNSNRHKLGFSTRNRDVPRKPKRIHPPSGPAALTATAA